MPEPETVRQMPLSAAEEASWVRNVRGLVLGLALGDALGSAHGVVPAEGPLRVGPSTQLAAFTIEGAIRALVRGDHRGICHPPSVVWRAYCRWGFLQGIEPATMRARWGTGTTQQWPDGWLAAVPALGQRRGSAPATVAALQRREQGTVQDPSTSSRGSHALTRTLPLAVLSRRWGAPVVTGMAVDVAALTHGSAEAHAATAAAVLLASRCLTSDSFDSAVGAAFPTGAGGELHETVRSAGAAGAERPADTQVLARLAPDATALSALRGGVYAAASYPDREQAVQGLRFAAAAPHGESVTAVTGALLGALHGVHVWPVADLSRLELVWVLDTLARDLLAQVTDRPGGTEYTAAADPYWCTRYPGG